MHLPAFDASQPTTHIGEDDSKQNRLAFEGTNNSYVELTMFLFRTPNIEKLAATRNVRGLSKALWHTKNPALCVKAAEALGNLGDPQAFEPLIYALRKGDHDLREAAACSLSNLIDSRNQTHVRLLSECLKVPSDHVRQLSVEILSKMRTHVPISLLTNMTRREGEKELREAKVRFLSKLTLLTNMVNDKNGRIRKIVINFLKGSGSEAVDSLLSLLENEDGSTRLSMNAVTALGEIGDPKAILPLIKLLEFGNPSIEKRVIEKRVIDALSRFGDQAVKPVIECLKTGKEPSYCWAEILQKIGKPAVMSLVATLKDKDAWVRCTSVETLGQIGDERAIEPLLKTVTDKDASVRLESIETLGQIGDERAIEPLLKTVTDKDASVRLKSIDILGQICDERAIEPVSKALRDVDNDVRNVAARVLGELGDKRAVEPLINALKDKGLWVGETAARSLGKIGDSRALEPLFEIIETAVGAFAEMRITDAIEALGMIGDEKAISSLIQLLRNDRFNVRVVAAGALKKFYHDERTSKLNKQRIRGLKDKMAEPKRIHSTTGEQHVWGIGVHLEY